MYWPRGGGQDKYEEFNTAELHLSGLNGTAGHPDMQKIRIIGFLYLQYVPASKPFDHA